MEYSKQITIDKDWTLFLDRDGVINKEEKGAYVTSWDQFEFLPGVLDALHMAKNLFRYILIVTNQQCIGQGLLSEQGLELIHKNMRHEIIEHQGRIDKIYHCPYLESTKPACRKPEVGMAMDAKKDFPEIDFHKSIMVGNFITDMQFGRNAEMTTVLVEEPERITDETVQFIDHFFPSLQHFMEHVLVKTDHFSE